MAKTSRSPESLSRKLSSSMLRVEDEFWNLKDAHRAIACLKGLLSPVHRTPGHEEFSIESAELRALLNVLYAELERRTTPVDAAIRKLRKRVKAIPVQGGPASQETLEPAT
jgi:hypothetical protein